MNRSTILFLTVIIAAFLLSYASNPPDARTGAPGELLCSSGCHGGGSFDGNIDITGLPSVVQAGTTYTVTLTVNVVSGNPATGGFQIVSLNSANQNTGNMIVINPGETGTNTSGGREYMEHRGDKNYSGGSVSWTFDWEAPNGPNNETIKFYFASVMANNNNGTTGDKVINSNLTVTLNAPQPPSAFIASTTHVSCYQGNDGAATASATGGTPPYDYVWSNNASGPTISNVTAGTYTVTVSDMAGLSGTAQAVINQPAPLSVSIVNQEPITCISPAIITVNASGGTPGFIYNWSTGHNGPIASITFNDLPATVTVTDNNDCQATLQITSIPTNNEQPAAQASGGVITCLQPTVTLSSAGSSSGPCFEYLWNGPNGFMSNAANPTVQVAGTYSLIVTNTCNGCTSSATASVTENIVPPSLFLADNWDTLHCNKQIVAIEVTQFPVGSTFAWSTQNGVIAYGQNDAICSVSKNGTYTIQVTDPVNGCTSQGSTMVAAYTHPTLQADLIEIPLCFGDSNGVVGLSVSQGLEPYTILWPDGNQDFQRMDIKAGSYMIIATDHNDCIDSLTIEVNEPSPVSITVSGKDESGPDANDGTATAIPSGGTPPYTFLWSNGAQSPTISDLPPGTYTVTVTDDNDCIAISSVIIQPFGCILSVNVNVEPILCFGDSGTIELIISNPSGPVQVDWNNGQQGEKLENVVAGAYVYNLIDSIGCGLTDTVFLQQPPSIVVAVDTIIIPTEMNADGAIYISVAGGEPGYAFEWKNEAGETVATQEDLADVSAGIYTLQVTDENGCVYIESYTLSTVGITIPWWNPFINIYPNPAYDHIALSLPENVDIQIKIFSVQGHIVKAIPAANGTNHRISLEELSSGLYYIVCTDQEGSAALRTIRKL